MQDTGCLLSRCFFFRLHFLYVFHLLVFTSVYSCLFSFGLFVYVCHFSSVSLFVVIYNFCCNIMSSLIKQFVLTNCSKERPGSIVTETLKSGILIPIVTSQESHFYAHFKYIIFVKFSHTHQNHTIRFSVSENNSVEFSSSYLQKCGI